MLPGEIILRFMQFDFEVSKCYPYLYMFNRLSREQRNVISEKLMDWGNLVFTGLVIAQFVPEVASFQWPFFFLGFLGIAMAYITGIFLMKMKGGDKI